MSVSVNQTVNKITVNQTENKVVVKELTPGVEGPRGVPGVYADSYTGHIGVVIPKQYFLDPLVVSDRTLTKFFGIATTGGCTAELRGGGTLLATLVVGTAGTSTGISSPSLSEGNTLTMEIVGNSGCQDFRFMVGFTLEGI